MAKTKQIKNRFYPLGTIQATINNQDLSIDVDISTHGARFKTTMRVFVELDGQNFERSRTFYFGEGSWLALSTIEEAVLDVLNGTEEDVEKISKEYDKLVEFNMPEFLVKDILKGFIKQEFDRLQAEQQAEQPAADDF